MYVKRSHLHTNIKRRLPPREYHGEDSLPFLRITLIRNDNYYFTVTLIDLVAFLYLLVLAALIFNVTLPFFLPLIVSLPFLRVTLAIFLAFLESLATESLPLELTDTFKVTFLPFLTVTLLTAFLPFLTVILAAFTVLLASVKVIVLSLFVVLLFVVLFLFVLLLLGLGLGLGVVLLPGFGFGLTTCGLSVVFVVR